MWNDGGGAEVVEELHHRWNMGSFGRAEIKRTLSPLTKAAHISSAMGSSTTSAPPSVSLNLDGLSLTVIFFWL